MTRPGSINMSSLVDAALQALTGLAIANSVLISRLPGPFLFLNGPFHLALSVRVVVVILILVNPTPSIAVAYLTATAAGLNRPHEGIVVTLASVLDSGGWWFQYQYIAANGRRPARFPKVPDLFSRWFTLIFNGVIMRLVLLAQWLGDGAFRTAQTDLAALVVGLLFVPSTLALYVGAVSFGAGTGGVGIALIVGANLDLGVYSELLSMQFDRRERRIEDEWERRLRPDPT